MINVGHQSHYQSEDMILLCGVNWSMWNICNTSKLFLQWKTRYGHCSNRSNGCHTTKRHWLTWNTKKFTWERLSIEAHPAFECPHEWSFTTAIQLQVKFLLPPSLCRDSGRFQFSSLAGWHPHVLWQLQSEHSMASCEEVNNYGMLLIWLYRACLSKWPPFNSEGYFPLSLYLSSLGECRNAFEASTTLLIGISRFSFEGNISDTGNLAVINANALIYYNLLLWWNAGYANSSFLTTYYDYVLMCLDITDLCPKSNQTRSTMLTDIYNKSNNVDNNDD